MHITTSQILIQLNLFNLTKIQKLHNIIDSNNYFHNLKKVPVHIPSHKSTAIYLHLADSILQRHPKVFLVSTLSPQALLLQGIAVRKYSIC